MTWKSWKLSIWPIQELQLAACFQELKSQWRHEGAWERPAWIGEHLADDLSCSKIRARKNRNAKQCVYIYIYSLRFCFCLRGGKAILLKNTEVEEYWQNVYSTPWLRYGKKGIPMKECSIRSTATRTPRNLFQQAEAHSTIEALNPKALNSYLFPVLYVRSSQRLHRRNLQASFNSTLTSTL